MIRTPRGRWGVLSPCFPWPIETEYKNYPSLINFLYDDTITPASKLLLKTEKVSSEKIIFGIKYMLNNWPQYKMYLLESPELKFANPNNVEFANMFNKYLTDAKSSIKKFKIKGKEVLEKKHKMEMLGAVIIGDEAIFDYDAKEQINKVVYNIDSKEEMDRLNIVGKMISQYIYLFDKIPDFLISLDENRSIYYAMVKNHTDQIAKILCTVNVKEFEEIKDYTEVTDKINDHIGYLWPYIVMPSELHPGMKKDSDISKMIKYHVDYNTAFKKEIIVRLQMLNFAFTPRQVEILQNEIKVDGTESEETDDVETLEFESQIEESEDEFADKWAIEGASESESESSKSSKSSEMENIPDPIAIEIQDPVEGVTGVQWVQPDGAQIVQPQVAQVVQPQVNGVQVAQNMQPQPQVVQIQPGQIVQPQPQFVQPQVMQLVQPQYIAPVPWEKRFSKITHIGHVIEPTNPLSPFGKNQVVWKGEKYENMLSVLYNEAILAVIGPGSTFKNSSTKARSYIDACNNKREAILIWFKDRGIEILKELVSTDLYKQRKIQMGLQGVSQLTYLYSRRKLDVVLLEPWIGVIKVDNGIPFSGINVGGWNALWTVQVS